MADLIMKVKTAKTLIKYDLIDDDDDFNMIILDRFKDDIIKHKILFDLHNADQDETIENIMSRPDRKLILGLIKELVNNGYDLNQIENIIFSFNDSYEVFFDYAGITKFEIDLLLKQGKD